MIHTEGYIKIDIRVVMPRLDRKRLPVCTEEQLQQILHESRTSRDTALVLVMADTGLRLEETAALRWKDVDLRSGLVQVRRGKGGKSRTVIIGAATRYALTEYQRGCVRNSGESVGEEDGVWLSHRTGDVLTKSGISLALKRLGRRIGINLSPHMLRRTFATLSLRSGMNPLHLQALLGHATLAMTQRYLDIVDDDLLRAHEQSGPVDHVLRRKRGSRREKEK